MLKMPSDGHLDAPETTIKRRKIILSKPFLYEFYRDCYSFFEKATKDVPSGTRLELGSGAGFLREYIPNSLKSDILPLPDLDLACSAQNLPFKPNTLSAIYMLNVLHHVQDATSFFGEVIRPLKPGGAIVMIEPASTLWGTFIYKNFHNEAFDKIQSNWQLPDGGPLSTANGALPWIIFERDQHIFKTTFPELLIDKIEYFSPLIYLASGGFSYKQLLPKLCLPMLKTIENVLRPLNSGIGLFMRIKLLRKR